MRDSFVFLSEFKRRPVSGHSDDDEDDDEDDRVELSRELEKTKRERAEEKEMQEREQLASDQATRDTEIATANAAEPRRCARPDTKWYQHDGTGIVCCEEAVGRRCVVPRACYFTEDLMVRCFIYTLFSRPKR